MRHGVIGAATHAVDPSTGRGRKSQSDILDDHLAHAVPLARRATARGIDAVEFRAWFAPRMSEFLRDRYDTPERVAVEFGVRNSTAWNWWNGDNRPSGDAVALLFLRFPDAAAWFLSEWRDRA